MKYFKNTNNEIFGFELDESQDKLITEDLVEIERLRDEVREFIRAHK